LPWTSTLSREQITAVAARAFGGGTVLLLALFDHSFRATISAALICGLAAGMAALTVRLPESLAPLATLEALISGVLIGVAVNDFAGVLAYSLVPAFVAGLSRRPVAAVSAVLVQFVCIDLLTLAEPTASGLTARLELTVPWLLISAGGACLAYWLVDTTPPPPVDDSGYESARRLLAQLRTVARRLSQGLDPVGIAQQILAEVDLRVEATRSVVLARSDGGVLQPLAEQGDGTARDLTAEDPLVMDCWTNEAPVQRPVEAAEGGRCIRVAVPLQVGVRMVGVVVLETSRTQSGPALGELRQALAEHCVRLDTALLFDEVRTLATAEERRRLAREIHDGIAQEIASLGYIVDSLVAEADTPDQADGLRGLRKELTRLTSELRLSIFDLRSEVSPTTGLGAVLSDYLRQVGSRSGLTVHLTLAEGNKRLPTATETEILRIAQEAITNCRKHANARNVHVSLVVEAPYARLTITDDGRGLGTPREDSFGLRTMQERSERVGATLRVRNRTTGSHGTEVTLVLEDRRRIGESRRMRAPDDVALPSRADGARVADSQRGEPSDAHVGPAHR
jgi:signal transduction histidine kinase